MQARPTCPPVYAPPLPFALSPTGAYLRQRCTVSVIGLPLQGRGTINAPPRVSEVRS